MDFIYSAIGKFLSILDGFTHSYILALLIFAIIVEVLLLPFGIRQQKNSIKQAKLRPKEMAIRKKYAGRNDQPTQQKVTQEIQELYTNEGYNPMGGCLPLLIQFPILIILYNAVVNPLRHMMGMSVAHIEGLVDYVNTTFTKTFDARNTIGLIDYIKTEGLSKFAGLESYVSEKVAEGEGAKIFESMSAAFGTGMENVPNFYLGSLNLAETPSLHQFGWLWLIPVLTFAVYFGSTKLTRKLTYQPTTANDPQVGCSNNIMDITMPMMSVAFTFMFPALLGVYWIFKSILSTLKQFILSRVMPLPTFTEEDYKAAEKEMKGKSKVPAGRNYTPSGTKPRSLHHIDDDDELPAPTPVKKDAGKKAEEPKKEDKPKESEGAASMLTQAPLKEDKPEEPSEKDASAADETTDNTDK